MMKAEDTNADDPEMVALDALIWLLHDERRAARLLHVSGLTTDGLRAGVGDHATLAAVMTFLEGHEPDLLACAAGMDVKPDVLEFASAPRRVRVCHYVWI